MQATTASNPVAMTSLRPIDLFVLTALAVQPSYGYQLARTAHMQGKAYSHSQIYHSLARLRRLGLITAQRQPMGTCPDRLVYVIPAQQRGPLLRRLRREGAAAQLAAERLARQSGQLSETAAALRDLLARLAHAFGSRSHTP